MSVLDKLVVFGLPLVPKPIVGSFARRYIAGERLEDAVRVIRNLNSQGMCATFDLLGEHSDMKQKAIDATDTYIQILDTIDRESLDSNVSLKPTQLGLGIDQDFCLDNIRRIVEHAKELNNFVRIDMEDHPYTTATLEMHKQLQEEFDNVGVVIQAYLRRTADDLVDLMETGANLRLCKGIYVEPRAISFRDFDIVRRNFVTLMERLLKNGNYLGIATHDEYLVYEATRIIQDLNLSKDRYEFQMLLGVDEPLRSIILAGGHKLRVYVPYGKDWYPYSTRRLKENPKMAGYVFKSIFGLDKK
ncbi:proline dehydrogenase [bacterium SM23_57]|nr:MAG: proline dehydrogenase [bacterium SM23_57]